MKRLTHLAAPFLALALLVGCVEGPGTESMAYSAPEGEIPFASESDEALEQFAMGQQAMDAQRFIEANRYFEAAVEADPTFAYGYLNAANTSASLEEYKTQLDAAATHAETADEGVRALIEIGQRGLENDAQAQLALARELTGTYPQSPRAWLTLAGIQSGLNQAAEARASIERAIAASPDFAPAYEALRLSYQSSEPVDLAAAETNARKVVELTPNESNAHENLGDALRAQGRLEDARAAYARATELAADDAVPILKMAHIDSFLGNYEQARTEYDQAISKAREGEKVTFPNYKAFTWVHEGDPATAIEELKRIAGSIDGLGLEPNQARGVRIFTLSNQAEIAIYSEMFGVARETLDERAELLLAQADVAGTDAFRRGQQANIAFWNGVLAAEQGEFETAQTALEELQGLVDTEKDPTAMDPAHYLMGLIALEQGDAEGAIPHLEQAPPGNQMWKFHLGLAHEAAGNTAEAQELFEEVANFNFNSVDFALVRKDALAKLETAQTASAR